MFWHFLNQRYWNNLFGEFFIFSELELLGQFVQYFIFFELEVSGQFTWWVFYIFWIRGIGTVCSVSFWYFLNQRYQENLFGDFFIFSELEVLGQFVWWVFGIFWITGIGTICSVSFWYFLNRKYQDNLFGDFFIFFWIGGIKTIWTHNLWTLTIFFFFLQFLLQFLVFFELVVLGQFESKNCT